MANCVPCQKAGRGPVVAHYNADPATGKPAQCWHCRNTPRLPHPMEPARVAEVKEVEAEMKTAKQNRTQWDPDKAAPANAPVAAAPAEESTEESTMRPARLKCQCRPGCDARTMIGRIYAFGHTPKKTNAKAAGREKAARSGRASGIEPQIDSQAPTTSNGHAPAEAGMVIESLTRAEYEAKYGAAAAWVSDEVKKIMKLLASAKPGDVVVVVPPVKKGETKNDAIKNLRDRIYRGFKQSEKTLDYKVKCSQVLRAGHVLVEKTK